MSRQRRILFGGVSVHVFQRGNNRCPTFGDDTDCGLFLEWLRRAAERNGVSVHAYVLMTNHYHLLVTPSDDTALPRTIKELGARYVQYYNRRYGRVGTLWSGRYRTILLLDDRYWLTCLRYIEQNPVRAQIVQAPEEYRWSSYRVHAMGESSNWLVPHQVYLALGADNRQRQIGYRAICGRLLSETELLDQRTRWGLTPT